MATLAEDHVNVDVALDHVIGRLLDAYRGRCSREQVEAAVAAAHESLAGARVEVFVPILVERAARARLDDQLAEPR
jgi:hypothetical protein